MTHRPVPASQENKESCNNFIRTMCFALEYFIINIKPPGPSPTPTHPLWILLCYILKLKNNISIHFSVSRYNLTHEMTTLNVILPRRQTLGLYTMDFLSSFMPVFSKSVRVFLPWVKSQVDQSQNALGSIQHQNDPYKVEFQPKLLLCTIRILFSPWMPSWAIPFTPASPQTALCLRSFQWTTFVLLFDDMIALEKKSTEFPSYN